MVDHAANATVGLNMAQLEAFDAIILDVSTQQSPVLYASNSIEITREVVALYDKNGPAGNAVKPAIGGAAPPAARPAAPPAQKKATPPAK